MDFLPLLIELVHGLAAGAFGLSAIVGIAAFFAGVPAVAGFCLATAVGSGVLFLATRQ